jgi:hypothetical protein
VNHPLDLVCLAFPLLARLLCAEFGFANEETKGLNGQGFRELQNAVLAKIFRRKEEEAIGDWRKFHNEFHDLNSSPNGWVDIVARWRLKDVYTEMCWKTRRNENI